MYWSADDIRLMVNAALRDPNKKIGILGGENEIGYGPRPGTALDGLFVLLISKNVITVKEAVDVLARAQGLE